MKKIIATVISLILIILSCTNVFAMKTISVELYDEGTQEYENYHSLQKDNLVTESIYVTDIFGEKYVTDKCGSKYYTPIKFDETLERAFSYEEYIITDNGYYTRFMMHDASDTMSRRRAPNYISLYDKDFNLIKTHRFEEYMPGTTYYDGGYIYDIAYIDGLYYSKYAGADRLMHVAVSSDFDEWTETEYGDIPKSNSECMITDNKVRFNGQSDFTEVLYEDEQLSQAYYQTMFGDWFVKESEPIIVGGVGFREYENRKFLTKDNVYFVKIQFDDGSTFDISNIVQDENYFALFNNELDYSTKKMLLVPKSELYNALNELEEVPYVRLGDKILGFSQPPVMESDRILVPMRFLFEQMGATVDWNNDTQSAIATIGEAGQERKVEFSIDNTTAFVNGKPETMDVPARLINDQTFVPLRFLSENLGYNVEWDDGARTAVITTK